MLVTIAKLQSKADVKNMGTLDLKVSEIMDLIGFEFKDDGECCVCGCVMSY